MGQQPCPRVSYVKGVAYANTGKLGFLGGRGGGGGGRGGRGAGWEAEDRGKSKARGGVGEVGQVQLGWSRFS